MKSFVYALIFIFSAALFYSVKQNFTASSSMAEHTISIQTEVVSRERTEIDLAEKESRQMVDLLDQADQVFNESWKVVLQTRSTPQSVFKSIKNALAVQLKKGSLPKNKLCVSTEVKRTATENGGSTYQVFKTDCRQKSKSILAQYRISVSSEAEILFYPQNLPESVGLALTVMNPKMYCRMNFDDAMLMKKMNCANLGQNFASNKHLLMTHLLYQNNQKEVLKLSAYTYENLQKEISRYNLIVPINGKIKLAEKKYDPKIIYVDAPKPVLVAKDPIDSKETKDSKPAADPFDIIADNEKVPEMISKFKGKKTSDADVDRTEEGNILPGIPGMDSNLNPDANVPVKQEANVEQPVEQSVEQSPAEILTSAEGQETKLLDETGIPIEEAIVETVPEHPGQAKVIQKNLNPQNTYIKQSAENIDVR